jgi:hypothetical protein
MSSVSFQRIPFIYGLTSIGGRHPRRRCNQSNRERQGRDRRRNFIGLILTPWKGTIVYPLTSSQEGYTAMEVASDC